MKDTSFTTGRFEVLLYVVLGTVGIGLLVDAFVLGGAIGTSLGL